MNSPDLAESDMADPLTELDLLAATRTNACILFTGARDATALALRIHNASGWRWGNFVSVDCAAPNDVIERQLCDILAAPGTHDLDIPAPYGRLRQAGTVLLEGVENLSPYMQARLADALERHSRRRLMASTPEPLLERVRDGRFDARLFELLNGIRLAAGADSPTHRSVERPE
jgi:DNA-binding NtrC family response regulator